MGCRTKYAFLIPLLTLAVLVTGSCSKGPKEVATTEGAAGTASAPGPVVLQPGTTFTADPNPLHLASGQTTGTVTLSWTSKAQNTSIRVDSPAGKVLTSGGSSGHATTGIWVTNGMIFYLQDDTAGHPDDKTATLATVAIAGR